MGYGWQEIDRFGGVEDLWKWRGIIDITARDLKGRYTGRDRLYNLIVDSGRNLARDMIRGAVADATIHYVALGTSFTTLTGALTNGQTAIVSLAVVALPAPLASGSTVTLINATGTTQIVTLSAPALISATAISVNSYTSNAAYGIGSAVMRSPAAAQTALDNEQFRKVITANSAGATGAGKTTTYIAPIEANAAGGFVIQEIGWFAGATATSSANSGVMVARVLYWRAKVNTESLQIDRTDQF